MSYSNKLNENLGFASIEESRTKSSNSHTTIHLGRKSGDYAFANVEITEYLSVFQLKSIRRNQILQP